MRNLTLSRIDEVRPQTDDTSLPLCACTYDDANGDLILALGPAPTKPVVELRRHKKWTPKDATTVVTSWDAPCPLPELSCDKILSLRYIAESQLICVILAGGDLILVRENPGPNDEKIEIVGSIDVGIAAASWSWNGAFLALVTREGSFVLMSQQLEPVNETALTEDDLKLSKHVSVGWGKKETQFQGKRAKAMKDPTMPESVDEGHPSELEDGETTISWRGDGAYVAVNSRFASPRRVIRVYSAEGVLDSVSEPVDGLESALSWRPYGNLIAGTKRSAEKLQVVFLERNGLRHGEFDLRLSQDDLSSIGQQTSLAWNCDSSILAVRMVDRVQFWTMGNYHYYLKRELQLDQAQSFIWHPNDPLRCLFFNKAHVQSILLELKVERASTVVPFDYGLVGVVDGRRLKLTPFKHVGIPPPMAFMDIEVDDNIIAHTISRTCQRIAILTREHMYLCQWQMRQASSKNDTSIRHTDTINVHKLTLPADRCSLFQYAQLAMLNDDTLYILIPARGPSDTTAANLYKHTWVTTILTNQSLNLTEVRIDSRAQQLLVDTMQQNLWVRTDLEVLSLSMSDTDTASAFPSLQRFSGTGRMSIANLPSLSYEGHCVFTLNESRQLFCNGELKGNEVTSFALTETHLVYTTSNHLLKFVHLTNLSSMSFPSDTPEVDERCRTIERGASVVTVIPSMYAVVLQMPRGNLETIYPRVMVVAGIRKSVGELNYRGAFIACQNHQVDLNILYDDDPGLWKGNVEKFIDQLKKPSWLDEFIQKLKEEDVTKTLYQDSSLPELVTNGHAVSPNVVKTSKVNGICDALVDILKKKPAAYQQNIITAHVCKRPPDLVAALTMVSDLRKTSQEEADLAVAHLCFLTDTTRLYDAALALYDLELTLLVAQNAQRDPREYMPFLQSLQALPVLRRQYTIDNYLKKYAKALESLHALEVHDEVEAYVVKHNLYTAAIDLYVHDAANLRRVTRSYADYLATQSQHQAAATLYESLSDNEAAYPLYALAHQWREALTCACLVPLSEDKLQALARSLATTCTEESRDYRSAATIHLEYLTESVVAAELLCKGSYFAEAALLLSHPGRNLAAQIPIVIDPMLTKKFGEIIELIAECRSQLSSQIPRIEELRIKKAEDPLAFFGGDAAVGDGADIPDNVSLAPTNASTLDGQSMFTRYGGGAGGSAVSTKFGGTVASNMSRKTSKTKRREERKRARGKKGSVYEEEYLVASVGRLIDRVNGTHDEVRRLLNGLMRRGLREQAKKVEEVMSNMQIACEDAKQRVWPEAEKEAANSDLNTDGQGRPSGADGVLYDSQIELQEGRQKPPPEVKVWKGGT